MIESSAKAVTAVAETGGKAIDGLRELGGFFGKVLGSALSEAGGALGDWTRFLRWKNLQRIEEKMDAIHAARKVQKTRPIPLKYAARILEEASWEDDESLQDLWAGLLANATDPEKRLSLKRIFNYALAALEPQDVRILKHLADQGWKQFRNVPGGGVFSADLVKVTAASEQDVFVSLQNLHRLGLIVDEFLTKNGEQPVPSSVEIGTTSFGVRVVDRRTTFRPSPLGHQLLKACEP
ncbi:MAG: DUF4393 domain-containing protein [Verrucomicrobia bacterium]|nr:DUF4393 domain-containing protein [Verrucomicrobiota bacterium]